MAAWGREVWENGGKGEGTKKYRLGRAMLRADIGNGVAKELICMTHGHEQRRGDCWREWGLLGGWRQRGKIWDNCNSIINFKKSKKKTA